MSWLCLFTLSCLANPAAPMSMPTPSEPIEAAIPVSSHVRPGRLSKSVGSAPLGCELRQVHRDGEQILLAVVHAAVPVKGEYEFRVGGRDAERNTVSSSTGGEFQIRAGERLELDGPNVSLGHGAALMAQLQLRDAQENILTTCRL